MNCYKRCSGEWETNNFSNSFLPYKVTPKFGGFEHICSNISHEYMSFFHKSNQGMGVIHEKYPTHELPHIEVPLYLNNLVITNRISKNC